MTSPTATDETARLRQVELSVTGMTCAACSSRVERTLNKLPGVQARVNFATGVARVDAAIEVADEALLDAVRRSGFGAGLVQTELDQPPLESDGPDRPRDLWRRLIVSVVLFVPVADLSVSFTVLPGWRFPGWQWLLIALAAPVVGWAALPFHRAAARNARHAVATMDTLVSLGILAATGWSVYAMFAAEPTPGLSGWQLLLRPDGAIYLEVAVGLTAFVLAGRYVEARAQSRAGGALRELAALRVREVTVVGPDGAERLTPIELLRVGQRFVVRPGGAVATDGRVVSGSGSLDVSAMTGESVPVEVGADDSVIGATVLVNGSLLVEATGVGADTRLAAMVALVARAQAGGAAVQRLADRICGWFVPAVVALATLTFAGWLVLDGSPQRAFAAGLAVLVIACPCALGLATPTALMVASGRGARLGIFIKGYQALESTRSIDTVVLDKTGTLTEGRMSLVDVVSADGIQRGEVLRLAGAVEAASEHPIAAAVVAAARAEVGELPAIREFDNRPGLGASGSVDGQRVWVGRVGLCAVAGACMPERLDRVRAEWERMGHTTVVVARDTTVLGVLGLADTVKPSATAAVAALHRLGLSTVLLTGDNAATARAVGAQVGIGSVLAEVLPDEKAAVVASLQAEGRVVAMVGDGVNDAPALAVADLGMAVGTGTDVAIDTADLILVRADLTVVPDAIALARATLRTIRGNLCWAFGYNVAAIPLAAAGLLNPLIAGAAMAFSSLFVVSNSLRLRRFTPGAARSTDIDDRDG